MQLPFLSCLCCVTHRREPNSSGLNAVGETKRLAQIAGLNAGCQAVGRVIRNAYRVLLVRERNDGTTGPKISSREIFISLEASANTVGSICAAWIPPPRFVPCLQQHLKARSGRRLECSCFSLIEDRLDRRSTAWDFLTNARGARVELLRSKVPGYRWSTVKARHWHASVQTKESPLMAFQTCAHFLFNASEP